LGIEQHGKKPEAKEDYCFHFLCFFSFESLFCIDKLLTGGLHFIEKRMEFLNRQGMLMHMI
jgi:hypothetical protein